MYAEASKGVQFRRQQAMLCIITTVFDRFQLAREQCEMRVNAVK